MAHRISWFKLIRSLTKGDVESACAEALRANRNDVTAHETLAQFYGEREEYALSYQHATSVLSCDANNLKMHLIAAAAAFRLSDLPSASEHAKTVSSFPRKMLRNDDAINSLFLKIYKKLPFFRGYFEQLTTDLDASSNYYDELYGWVIEFAKHK